jgi:futalosine hydrolase
VITPDGWRPLEYIGIPSLTKAGNVFFNRFPMTRWSIDKAGLVAETNGIPLHQGVFVTLSTSSGSGARGDELFQRYNALCENMEGGAVAQVAALYGVDCLEVRGVSNLVEDRDISRWDIPLAVERAQRFILDFIKALCQG